MSRKGVSILKTEEIDSLLKLGPGAFSHIPKYCREDAIEAISHVRRMEEERLFRPGLYYVALADLSGATAASAKLGSALNRKRVESFITVCVESLGLSKPENYAQFVKPVGDAALLIFSSFSDLHAWWTTAQSRMQFYSFEWNRELSEELRTTFQLRSKTVVHVGEVAYSDGKDPVSMAVNQIFKIEKLFTAGELGCTEIARSVAFPLFVDLGLHPERREEVELPGSESPTLTWLLARNEAANFDLS